MNEIFKEYCYGLWANGSLDIPECVLVLRVKELNNFVIFLDFLDNQK